MQNLSIPGTLRTPAIDFDFGNNHLKLSGESYPEDVTEFTRRVPMAEAVRTGKKTVSNVYVNQRRREALMAMVIPIQDRMRQVTWYVTGEVSLRDVQRAVSDVVIGMAGHAYLVDSDGRAVAHPLFDVVRDRRVLTGDGIVDVALNANRPGTASFTDDEGVRHYV